MPALAERIALTAPDLRGLGDSDRPSGPYDSRTVAAAVAELMTQLGHDAFSVVAHDIAGDVGFALAAQHPERVRRLVMLETTPSGIAPSGKVPDAAKAIWHPPFHATPDLPEALVRGRERE